MDEVDQRKSRSEPPFLMLKNHLRNASFSISGQLVNLCIGLVFAGVSIRYLGTARTGFFIVAVTILQWINIAGIQGLRAALVQRLSSESKRIATDESRDIVGALAAFTIVLTLVLGAVTIASFPILFRWSKLDPTYREDAWHFVGLSCASFVVEQWSASLRTVYVATQRFDLNAYITSGCTLVANSGKLLSLMVVCNMTGVGTVSLIVGVSALLIDIILVRRLMLGGGMPKLNFRSLRPLYKIGILAWAGDTIGSVANSLGQLVTTYYLGSAPLQYLAIPQRLVGQIHAFVANSCYFLFPTLASDERGVLLAFKLTEDRLRWFVASTTWLLYLVAIVLGKQILTVIGGCEFANFAYGPYLVCCLVMAVNSLNIVYSYACMAGGRIVPSIVTENVSATGTALGYFALIPKFGYLGAAFSTLCKIPAVCIQCIWSRRTLELDPSWRAELAPYVGPACAFASGFFLWRLLIMAGLCGSIFREVLGALLVSLLFVLFVIGHECLICRQSNRWETLRRAIGMLRKMILELIRYKAGLKVHKC